MMLWNHRSILAFFLLCLFLTACITASQQVVIDPTATPAVCPVTEPEWVTPPDDPAVLNEPQPGYYFVNQDRSIWAAGWWFGEEEKYLRVNERGIKTGWFRPAGAELEITGTRLDGDAPPFHAHIPCCYPTRFQATGLVFPVEGCWEVNASAADSWLTFTVQVFP